MRFRQVHYPVVDAPAFRFVYLLLLPVQFTGDEQLPLQLVAKLQKRCITTNRAIYRNQVSVKVVQIKPFSRSNFAVIGFLILIIVRK